MTPLYTATVEVSGGRGGHARSLTGGLEVTLTRPADRGSSTENGGATGTDPEELFAAGYAACFDSALAVATADTLCPYSNAVRGNIPVEIRLS